MKNNTIYQGDCLSVLQSWDDECIDCCVTSPPYWGLRDYGNPDQLGLEPTPEEYTAKMTAIFAEVKRVLKPAGTLWLNLGDSYCAGGGDTKAGFNERYHGKQFNTDKQADTWADGSITRKHPTKPKDLVGIPWRVAFALQADGWYLRSDIIWHKPNPMPESVTDRPTSAHEHIFLFSKSSKYWYDADAIREEHQESSLKRIEYGLKHKHPDNVGVGIPPVDTDRMGERFCNPSGRNSRNVWTMPTQPYPGAHFAVFPPELPRRCILAGCPAGGVVLDPFFGSGTTGLVAEQLGRNWVGIELSEDYITLAKDRTKQSGLFV